MHFRFISSNGHSSQFFFGLIIGGAQEPLAPGPSSAESGPAAEPEPTAEPETGLPLARIFRSGSAPHLYRSVAVPCIKGIKMFKAFLTRFKIIEVSLKYPSRSTEVFVFKSQSLRVALHLKIMSFLSALKM